MDEVKQAAVDVYEPPTIEDIPLRPDEQVVAGCKTSNPAIPGVTSAFGCFTNSCFGIGSS